MRLTKRSPLFKLKIQNVALWLIAPTAASKYYYDNHIHERIDSLWKIHTNRVDRGLGATYSPTNIYNDKMQDYTQQYNIGLQASLNSLITGQVENLHIDNPFTRMHKTLEEYPDFLDDIDDVSLVEYDQYERFKPFEPKQGTTIGDTPIIPLEDNDQKLFFYDLQGESIYTNPPDTNIPTVDHGLDEDHIWAWARTGYNQFVVKNQYLKDPLSITSNLVQPHWGQKLMLPSFYKEEKMQKFLKQWEIKTGLERIKLRQAIQYKSGDKEQYQRFKEEIEGYLCWAEE